VLDCLTSRAAEAIFNAMRSAVEETLFFFTPDNRHAG